MVRAMCALSVVALASGDTCSLYKIQDGGCGQSDLECQYTKYAKAAEKGLLDGTCTEHGYSVKTGTTTKSYPIIGDIVVTQYSEGLDAGVCPWSSCPCSGDPLGAPCVKLGAYPGYAGDLKVTGEVNAYFSRAGTVHVTYDLKGLEDACKTTPAGVGNACGIHIHAGKTCADASAVGGHYYDTASISSDPWSPLGYNSRYGRARGNVKAAIGKGADIAGRAMVVHDSTGARVACATLPSKLTTRPGQDVEGKVEITDQTVADFGMVCKQAEQLKDWTWIAKKINHPEVVPYFKAHNVEGWEHCAKSWIIEGACAEIVKETSLLQNNAFTEDQIDAAIHRATSDLPKATDATAEEVNDMVESFSQDLMKTSTALMQVSDMQKDALLRRAFQSAEVSNFVEGYINLPEETKHKVVNSALVSEDLVEVFETMPTAERTALLVQLDGNHMDKAVAQKTETKVTNDAAGNRKTETVTKNRNGDVVHRHTHLHNARTGQTETSTQSKQHRHEHKHNSKSAQTETQTVSNGHSHSHMTNAKTGQTVTDTVSNGHRHHHDHTHTHKNGQTVTDTNTDGYRHHHDHTHQHVNGQTVTGTNTRVTGTAGHSHAHATDGKTSVSATNGVSVSTR